MKHLFIWSLALFIGLNTSSAQFSEDFESGTFPPVGWTTYHTGASNLKASTAFTVSDTTSALFEFIVGGDSSWLISPQIMSLSDSIFEYQSLSRFISFYDYHGLWISTTSNDPSTGSFVEVSEDLPIADGAWETVRRNLSAYTGQNVYIAFLYVGDDADSWYIDDIATLSCLSPTQLNAYNVGLNNIDVTWNGGTASSWDIEYGPKGFTPGTGTHVVANNDSASIGSLMAGTTYDYYVRSICGAGDTSISVSGSTRTTCIITAPFKETFDGLAPQNGGLASCITTNYLDTFCWSNNTAENTNWTPRSIATGSSNTGPSSDNTSGSGNYLFIESSSCFNTTATLTSPLIDISSVTNPLLKFYYHLNGVDSASAFLSIAVSADTGASWTSIFIDSSDRGANWIEDTIAIGSYSSTTIMVRFTGTTGSTFASDIAIDDIEILKRPSCFEADSVSLTSITDSTAMISWVPSSVGASYNVEYGPTGFTLGTGTVINSATTNTVLTNLMENTVYQAYVYTICGPGDTSIATIPISFLTPCAPKNLPYLETFDALTPNDGSVGGCQAGDNVVGVCWENDTSNTNNWVARSIATGSPNTGPTADHTSGSGNYLYTEASTCNNNSSLLNGPSIIMNGLTNPELSFAYHLWGADNGQLITEISVNGGMWQTLKRDTGDLGNAWQEAAIDLNSYIGDTIRLRFNGITGTDFASDVAIDDIKIDEAPTCPKPTNLSLISVDETTALITWNESGSASQWQVTYDTAGHTLGSGTNLFLSADTATLSGLNSLTSYEVYVRSICSPGDSSTWLGPLTLQTIRAKIAHDSCGLNLPILDNSCNFVDNRYAFDISGVTPDTLGAGTNLKSIELIIEHTWANDIALVIVSPSLDTVALSIQNGGSDDDYGDINDSTCTQTTTFDMSATDSIQNGTAPFIGSFIPIEDLNAINSGTGLANGTWQLLVCDLGAGDFGTLEYVKLNFQNTVSVFDYSNKSNELTIYPNPNNGSMSVINNSASIMNRMEIIDIQGRILSSSVINLNKGEQLAINETILPGVYFVRFFSDKNMYLKRVVVK